MAKATLDTGVVGTVKVDAPRWGSGTSRFMMGVKPVALAVHDGQDPDEVRAFAQHLCDVWAAYMAKHAVRRSAS